MWGKFNIKTFPAETVVYRDGVFCPELSTIVGTDFYKKYDKPIHIIYIGEIAGNCRLDVNVFVENQPVFLTVKYSAMLREAISSVLPFTLNPMVASAAPAAYSVLTSGLK